MPRKKTMSTGDLASELGVTPQTIRTYTRRGTIPHHTRPSGQLIFTQEDQKIILGENNLETDQHWAYYIRSSSGRTSSFQRQTQELEARHGTNYRLYKDSASGLNENRKNLWKLIADSRNGEITDIAVTNQDRLSRFGSKYLEEIFDQNGVKIHYLHPESTSAPEQELMSDFMALIASFSGRFYKLRSKENSKKLLEKASKTLDGESSD